MRTWIPAALALVVAGLILGREALPADDARVLASVEGPTAGTLGTYRGHEGHPMVRYAARIDTGATTFRFSHWVDVDKSHAP